MSEVILEVERLKTHFFTEAGVVKAVDDVSLTIARGEVVGLVGESGSGKSMLGFSILGLIDAPGRIVSGDVRYRGRSLIGLAPHEMATIRGNRIAMVFQDPTMTLNPVLRIDTQLVEAVLAHNKVSRKAALARAIDVMRRVGIPSPEERVKAYPHQFSGGMRQRVAIAIAFINKPDVIICDEPTTALDVTIQGQILHQFQELCREDGTALLWISHDLGAVSSIADRILTMYAGHIIESGPAEDVLRLPRHPYTAGLIRSIPSQSRRGEPLYQIPGSTPNLLSLPEGCPFRARCWHADAACTTFPTVQHDGSEQHAFLCWHPENSL